MLLVVTQANKHIYICSHIKWATQEINNKIERKKKQETTRKISRRRHIDATQKDSFDVRLCMRSNPKNK